MQSLGIDVLFKGTNFLRLLGGLWVALRISLISVAISTVLGIAMGMLMTSKSRVLKAIFRVYLEIVRIMPQMVLLFVVYFGTTRVFGWNLEAEAAAIILSHFVKTMPDRSLAPPSADLHNAFSQVHIQHRPKVLLVLDRELLDRVHINYLFNKLGKTPLSLLYFSQRKHATECPLP